MGALAVTCGLAAFASQTPGATPRISGADASRIVAIGDVHGAIDGFSAILRKASLIDDQGRWSGGRAVLVQTGDVSDRGAGMRAALDLLMALERQASAAGGRVHVLLGNHEVMNMLGETRDVTPEIFTTFGGEAAMREAFGPRGRYGRWLRSKPVIGEVNDSIFMHAGINPEFPPASVRDLNRRARQEIAQWDEGVKWLERRKLVSAAPKFLEAVEAARAELARLAASPMEEQLEQRETIGLLAPVADIGLSSLFHPEGLLWFRGFATWDDQIGEPNISAILERMKKRRFVTGHTVQTSGRITERFGGKLFLIDTGMFFTGGRPSALEITGQSVRQIYLD